MMVKMTRRKWTMRSTSLHRRDRSLSVINLLFYPVLRSSHASNPKPSAKPKKAAPITSLNVAIHESEINFQTGIQPCHRFEVCFHHLLVCLLKEEISSDYLRTFIIHSREIRIVREISARYTSRSQKFPLWLPNVSRRFPPHSKISHAFI